MKEKHIEEVVTGQTKFKNATEAEEYVRRMASTPKGLRKVKRYAKLLPKKQRAAFLAAIEPKEDN